MQLAAAITANEVQGVSLKDLYESEDPDFILFVHEVTKYVDGKRQEALNAHPWHISK